MVFTKEQLTRYSRHFVMPEIGVKGQKALQNARILVIGAGALGSISLMYLAAAGVGTIGIADSDKVELSNLHRQLIHRTDMVGESKLLSAKKTMNEINPDCNVILHEGFVTPKNIMDIIKDYDFIVDGTDRFETKFLINDACVLAEKPFVHAGIVRFGGQAMTYVPHKSPCLRCVLGGIPKGNEQTCSQVGVVGAAVGVLGSIQALEAIKYITGAGELLTGRVMHFDGLKMKFNEIGNIPADNRCKICGEKPEIKDLFTDDYTVECKIG